MCIKIIIITVITIGYKVYTHFDNDIKEIEEKTLKMSQSEELGIKNNIFKINKLRKCFTPLLTVMSFSDDF